MNKENAELLMKRLDEYREQFSMEWWFMDNQGWTRAFIQDVDATLLNYCGTTACIAGHAAIISGQDHGRIKDTAQIWLDLTDDEVTWLFEGYFADLPLGDITVEHAMDALDYLMKDLPIRDEDAPFGHQWIEIARPTNE
jgi:hypothetical protein